MHIDEVKRRLRETHGEIVAIDESTFTGFKNHAKFVDIEFGEWTAHVYAVCRGGRHPKRFLSSKRITLKDAQDRIHKVFGDTITIDASQYSGATSECTFIDSEFGQWRTTLRELLNSKGHPERAKLSRADNVRWTKEELNELLINIDCGRITMVGPYTDMSTRTTFLDRKFGEFAATPLNVIHHGTGHPKRAIERRSETMMKNFGVPHHLQNDVQFQKAWKARFTQYREKYWLTGESLLCTGGWELKVVRYLNNLQIEFLWQPKAFRMPDGRTYRPDLFLIKENIWVEIKGYFPEQSREKWTWFQTIYPNSELWDKVKLTELGIL